jgi:hypothetical protein
LSTAVKRATLRKSPQLQAVAAEEKTVTSARTTAVPAKQSRMASDFYFSNAGLLMRFIYWIISDGTHICSSAS